MGRGVANSMDNRSTVLLAFLAGVAIGINWPKVRKHLKPYLATTGEASTKALHGLLGLIMSAKEQAEDVFAEAKIKKTNSPGRTNQKTAKKRRKRTQTA